MRVYYDADADVGLIKGKKVAIVGYPKDFYTFNTNQQKANAYNISINVAPGASGAQIGQAFVNSIQEYERVKGTGWRQKL